jgi:hypothetical protein
VHILLGKFLARFFLKLLAQRIVSHLLLQGLVKEENGVLGIEFGGHVRRYVLILRCEASFANISISSLTYAFLGRCLSYIDAAPSLLRGYCLRNGAQINFWTF